MIPTPKAINRCRTLRGCTMLLLGNFLRSADSQFDQAKLDILIEPLPEATQHKLRTHFLGIVRVWQNLKLHGKKYSNTTINRRICRLDLACYKAEYNYGTIWNRNHPEATCTR